MEPRFMKTMSWTWMWIRPAPPAEGDVKWISETVVADPGANDREVTLVSRDF